MHAHALPSRFGHSKTYLGVTASRRAALDHPVGDPFGGAAYGEKRMPAAAIIGIAMAAADIAVVGLGVLNGLALAGSAMSFIGSATGNKALANIGGVLSLGAGIGSIANNWGQISQSLSGGADLANTAAEAANTGAATAGNTIADSLAAAGPIGDAPMASVADGAVNGGAGLSGAAGLGDAPMAGGIISNVMGEAPGAAGITPDLVTSGGPLGDAPMSGKWSAGDAINTAPTGGKSPLGDWSYDAPTSASTTTDYGGSDLRGSYAPSANSTAGSSLDKLPTMGDAPMATKVDGVVNGGASNSGAVPGKGVSVTEWVRKNKELLDVGSRALAGVGDSMTKKDLMQMKVDAETALQQNNFNRADELMRRFSEGIKSLQIKDNINPNANIYNTPNGQNVTQGFIGRNMTLRSLGG